MVLRLIADLLALIPREVQLQCGCASHIIQSADCPDDAAILFTYPDAPFYSRQAIRADNKAPILFDFVGTQSTPNGPLGKYAAALTDILQSPQCPEQLSLARENIAVLESGPEDRSLFPMFWKLYDGFRQMKSISELDAFS